MLFSHLLSTFFMFLFTLLECNVDLKRKPVPNMDSDSMSLGEGWFLAGKGVVRALWFTWRRKPQRWRTSAGRARDRPALLGRGLPAGSRKRQLNIPAPLPGKGRYTLRYLSGPSGAVAAETYFDVVEPPAARCGRRSGLGGKMVPPPPGAVGRRGMDDTYLTDGVLRTGATHLRVRPET